MKWLLRPVLCASIVAFLVVSGGTPVVFSQDPAESPIQTALPIVAKGEGSGAQKDPEAVHYHAVPEEMRGQVENYWTKERMEEAQPLPIPLLPGDPPEYIDLQSESEGQPADPVEVPGQRANPDLEGLARELYPEDWGPVEDVDLGEGDRGDVEPFGYYLYPGLYTRYYVNSYGNMWKEPPWMRIGKLFFTIPGQGDYYCTGSAGGNRTVWTAGHCVYTPGVGWHDNMTFAPAYRDGSRPYGTFTAFNMAAPYGWTTYDNRGYDQGMAVVYDNSGYMLSDWVGALGAVFSARSIQQWHAVGYPSAMASGKYSICCSTSTARRDYNFEPWPIGVGCDMQHGSSGGPWLVNHQPFSPSLYVNRVNGMVSYGYTGYPEEFYAPYFGSAALNLYNWGIVL